MRTRYAAPLALVLLASGCASLSPERADRNRLVLRAIALCAQDYPTVRVLGFDDRGRLRARASPGNMDDLAKFRSCADDAVKRELHAREVGAGRVAPTAGPVSVPIQMVGTVIVLPALVNSVPATLLLDTGATTTIVRPGLVRRAGIEVPPDAPTITGVVVGGRRFSLPYVRVPSLAVGDAAVENIDVGVFDALAHMPHVDGLLGGNFLHHFNMTIDRENRRLTLQPSRAAPAGSAAEPDPLPSPPSPAPAARER